MRTISVIPILCACVAMATAGGNANGKTARKGKRMDIILDQKRFQNESAPLSFKNWTIHDGGRWFWANEHDKKKGVPTLTTTRVQREGKGDEAWLARLLCDKIFEIYQGRRYQLRMEVRGTGTLEIGGDSIRRIAARLKTDVIDRNPSLVFIFEGANDCKRPYQPDTGTLGDWAVPQDDYENTYRQVVKAIQDETKARITIATCAPGNMDILNGFAEDKKNFGMSGNLFCRPDEVAKVVSIQKEIAADNGLDLIDTNKLLTEYAENRKKTSGDQFLHVDDGVHLSEYGNREMAKILLRHLTENRKNK